MNQLTMVPSTVNGTARGPEGVVMDLKKMLWPEVHGGTCGTVDHDPSNYMIPFKISVTCTMTDKNESRVNHKAVNFTPK